MGHTHAINRHSQRYYPILIGTDVKASPKTYPSRLEWQRDLVVLLDCLIEHRELSSALVQLLGAQQDTQGVLAMCGAITALSEEELPQEDKQRVWEQIKWL